MHGVILGGALSLALNIPMLPVTFILNLVLILAMFFFAKGNSFGFSGGTAAAMILTMALSSFIMHIADVPAKDTLSVLWGSPFALKKTDLLMLILMSAFLVLYVVVNFKTIITLFFNMDIAKSLGINTTFHFGGMVCLIALIVALSMKILGAFLVDALLILPVLCSSMIKKNSGGLKKLFIKSSILGFCFAVAGYVLAVMFNWPPAATISMLAAFSYLVIMIFTKNKNDRTSKI